MSPSTIRADAWCMSKVGLQFELEQAVQWQAEKVIFTHTGIDFDHVMHGAITSWRQLL